MSDISRYLDYVDETYEVIVKHLVEKKLPPTDERIRLYFGVLVERILDELLGGVPFLFLIHDGDNLLVNPNRKPHVHLLCPDIGGLWHVRSYDRKILIHPMPYHSI